MVSGPQGLAGIVTDREDVVTCQVNATLDGLARPMWEYRVRRIAVAEDWRLSDLVSFDALPDGAVPIESLRET